MTGRVTVHRAKIEGPRRNSSFALRRYERRLRVDRIILGQDLTKESEGEQACLTAADVLLHFRKQQEPAAAATTLQPCRSSEAGELVAKHCVR